MRKFLIPILALLVMACAEEETKGFVLKGKIDGLKKGTVYLERQQDSTMVVLDSLSINGQEEFQLTTDLNEPEILMLRLDKNDTEEGRIVFFADNGITEITTTLKNFNFDSQISGSEQQKVLDDYLLTMSKFNDRNLDMIKESLESARDDDSTKVSRLREDYDNLIKRKYLYTINFAINNKDSEVAPYLAISEIPNTSNSFLEKIYDALDQDIKESLYGSQLKETIEWRKKQEADQE